MRLFSILVLSFAVVLNSFESSSQTSNTPSNVTRSGVSSSPVRDPPETSRLSVRRPFPDSANIFPPSTKSGIRIRSRSPHSGPSSPSVRNSSLTILGYKIEELNSIRLIPYTNTFQRFEIRRYTFPRDTPLQMEGDDTASMIIPTGEQSVLSTSEGDVFGIVRDDARLHGILSSRNGVQRLSKINMYSRAIRELTRVEAREGTLLTFPRPILENFNIIRVNNSPPRLIRFPILNRSES